MHSKLDTYEIQPTLTHQYSLIWLHGLGADGHDFEDIVPKLHLNAEPNIHFIFPHAPIQPVTINGGKKMRAWFDILEMAAEHKVNLAGIYQSAGLIDQLIQQEIDQGVPPENILLAGFSQGGTIALHAGLRYPYKLAGIIALSTYLPTLEQLKAQHPTANYATPIFMAHGIIDSTVAIEYSKKAYDDLTAMGYSVEWHDYLMEHTVCVEEIEHISDFINSLLK